MKLARMLALVICGISIPSLSATWVFAQESIWFEAEHLHGVRGSCFPDFDQKTAGHWALSGPGIAPEWTQGAESEWLSIACAPEDEQAAASRDCEVPEAGEWRLWVRYRDWREQTELFAVRIEQTGQPPQQVTFGEKAVIDENDELKLIWKWAFAWDMRSVKLVKGPAKLTLLSLVKQPGHRQVDSLCLTTDAAYRPRHREKPKHLTWKLLDELRTNATQTVAPQPLAARAGQFEIPEAWKLRTYRDNGFVYLWNAGQQWQDELASTAVNRIHVPFNVDVPLVEEFRKLYGGKTTDIPIFGDSRIVPTVHGAGPNILDNEHFVKWLEANPDRAWGNLMNYTTPVAMTDRAKANWPKFRDRYVGNIAGEGIGVLSWDNAALAEKLKAAKSRADVAAALGQVYLAGKAVTEKTIFGADVPNPYQSAISCLSCEMTAHAHLCREWGATTVGFESSAVMPGLGMRMAFLRGSARQYGGMWATYRSCNFGDAATIYAKQGYFYPAQPQFAYDNQYDMWAGAGNTWYKFDIWHQYMSGAAMTYHEQGHDEFWQPGGQSINLKPLQLSPKGTLVDQFLRMTREHPDRGTPVTPIAFLLDQAHGWEPNGYQPGAFGQDPNNNPAVLGPDRHARSLKEWFKVAFHPYGPKEAEINTGVNQIFLPSQFGNIFDVLVTTPTRRDAIDTYPVVILGGEVTLSAEWGAKLASYLENGGTVIVSDDQLTGPGTAALNLPALGNPTEDAAFEWLPINRKTVSQRFRYRPITGGTPLAKATNGDTIAASFDRGKGRLVMLSIPRGLGLDDSATPLVPLIIAHSRQGLLPVEVLGDVEWLLNRTADSWLLTLLNPAGINKPQHGIVPTDYSQERTVQIRSLQPLQSATEWFSQESLPITGNTKSETTISIPAGGVRIIELR